MKISTVYKFTLAVLLVGCDQGIDDLAKSSESTLSDTDNGQIAGAVDHCADPVAILDEDGNFLVIAEDRMNYSFESSLDIQTVPVRSLSDISFDWSEITEDMLGQPFDPLQSVDMVEVMLWKYSKEALVKDINDDNLDLKNIVSLGYFPTENQATSANFLEMLSPSGGDVTDKELLEYMDTSEYPVSEYSYVVMLAAGELFGGGTKMISFFDPASEESNTEVRLHNKSTTLTFKADLTSLKRIAVPPANPNIVLDWSDIDSLLKNALGGDFIPNRITDVMVAHYRTKSPEDLEREFLGLDNMADEVWSIFLSAGQSVNLGRLNTEADYSGTFFPGIDDTGTWIVALKCGTCNNPAPWFLSILQSCP